MIIKALGRFLLRSPWSTMMAVLGVVLGVTSIVAVHLVSTSVARQLDDLIPGPLHDLEGILQPDILPLASADYFGLRKKWRQGEITGIQDLWPVIDESMRLGDRRVRVLGIDFVARSQSVGLKGSQAALDTDAQPKQMGDNFLDGVWVSRNIAEEMHNNHAFNRLQVLGQLDVDDLIVMDIASAQMFLKWPQDHLSYVAVDFANPIHDAYRWLEDVAPGISAGLPEVPAPELTGWRVKSLGEMQPANRFGKAVLFNVGALGLLALVVAWFLIYQVAVSWLRRLWQIFVRLHVLGVGYPEIRLYFIGLMILLGTVSGVTGLGLGRLLADGLLRVSVGSALQVDTDVWLIVKAMGSALAVCMLGGIWAFAVATRAAHFQKRTRLQGMFFVAVLVVLCLGVAWEASGLLGAFVAIAATCIITLAMLVPVLIGLRSRSSTLGGHFLLRMSMREAVWFPGDLWVALGGLVLAVATAIGVGLMVDSFRSEFSQMLDRRLSQDFSAEGNAEALSELHAQLRNNISTARVQVYRERGVRLAGVPVFIDSTDTDVVESKRYGYSYHLAADEVMISEQAARVLGVLTGDSLDIDGSRHEVVHVFKSFGDMLLKLKVDQASAVAGGEVTSLGISLAVPPRLELPQVTGVRVQRQADIRESALRIFDQTFAITSVLIAIAVIVAGIGVYVAVTVLRLNQQASARLLESMGISAGERLLADFGRGVSLGVIACLIAIPLGVVIGWLLCGVVNPRAFGWSVTLRLSAGAIIVPFAWGVMAAVIAAVIRVGQTEQGRFDAVAR